ncbi:DUF3299 domain-containing protein [Roseobacter sp. S98]|uniref:DUF3299 domain-containing protein n=1 Tax=Roseobacter algicola (ex Choi et al. 2025) (nom. illeg.) TaxID=3092138 RepID=UPI0035C77306
MVTRRGLLTGLAASVLLPRPGVAAEVVDLSWADLLPEGQVFVPPLLQEFIDHSGPSMSDQQPASTGVRTDWNGQTVRIPGFVLPIEHRGTGVSAFILVPYVGACIHVPPPPANQLVFVTPDTPYESGGMFEPVRVTGRFGVTTVSTQLAEVGYAMAAERIDPIAL